jgi:hypothetical protein
MPPSRLSWSFTGTSWSLFGTPAGLASHRTARRVRCQGLAAQFLSQGDGTEAMGPLEVQALISQASAGQPEVMDYQGKRYLVESLCHEGTIYIFGAGHVSQQVAPNDPKAL